MTKISINRVALPNATVDLFAEVLAQLPETSLVAYHGHANLLYVRDDNAESVLSYLRQAGIEALIV